MARLNRKRVEEIFTMSKQEKWAYPRIFDALKNAGVEYCETDLATHDIVYHGAGDAIPEPPPPEFTPLKPSASFAARGVKLAMERNKTKPDYMAFLEDMARAGVVDIAWICPHETWATLALPARPTSKRFPPF
jgi:uncharacterized protein YbcV (DUF1398 family)